MLFFLLLGGESGEGLGEVHRFWRKFIGGFFGGGGGVGKLPLPPPPPPPLPPINPWWVTP